MGVEIAQKVFEGKLTLEEYLNESTAPTTIENNIERPEIKEETNTEPENNNKTESTGSETTNNNQNVDGDNTQNSGTNNQNRIQKAKLKALHLRIHRIIHKKTRRRVRIIRIVLRQPSSTRRPRWNKGGICETDYSRC